MNKYISRDAKAYIFLDDVYIIMYLGGLFVEHSSIIAYTQILPHIFLMILRHDGDDEFCS